MIDGVIIGRRTRREAVLATIRDEPKTARMISEDQDVRIKTVYDDLYHLKGLGLVKDVKKHAGPIKFYFTPAGVNYLEKLCSQEKQ